MLPELQQLIAQYPEEAQGWSFKETDGKITYVSTSKGKTMYDEDKMPYMTNAAITEHVRKIFQRKSVNRCHKQTMHFLDLNNYADGIKLTVRDKETKETLEHIVSPIIPTEVTIFLTFVAKENLEILSVQLFNDKSKTNLPCNLYKIN